MATWAAASGVVLNEGQREFLDRLVTALAGKGARTPVYVTSGTRTPAEQARALWTKFQALGESKFRAHLQSLYAQKDLVAELLAAPRSAAGLASALTEQVAKSRFLSRHMRGDAVDLRIKDLTSAQVAELKAAAAGLGVETVLESTPPHLHVEELGSLKARAAAALTSAQQKVAAGSRLARREAPKAARTAARRTLWVAGISGGLGLLLVLGLALASRGRARSGQAASAV